MSSALIAGQVHPRFLNSNATSHTWAFGAIAELIDNAYDPNVKANKLDIDEVDINGKLCLTFKDDGSGMDDKDLTKMLSFGFCDKEAYNKKNSYDPIGKYGNGFKSGSMRLGKDVLVITRCNISASVGFLSQTYLENISAETIQVPIVHYKLPQIELLEVSAARRNLEAILRHSPFREEEELKREIRALELALTRTGTKIIIFNLKRLEDGRPELDFSSDLTDIRCPEAHQAVKTNPENRPMEQKLSEYKQSLREYCSILYFRPRMKIVIRGKDVKNKYFAKSLRQTRKFFYTYRKGTSDESSTANAVDNNMTVAITFGFTCEEGRSKDYGMMLYHRNRLIKGYEKVGCQKQNSGRGVDVVGVATVDMLTPTHNKQDFVKDDKYNSVFFNLSVKLNQYLKSVEQDQPDKDLEKKKNSPDWLWVQCDHCRMWRRLPSSTDKNLLPKLWYCFMNPDNMYNRCDMPEEPDHEEKGKGKRRISLKRESQESNDVLNLKLPTLTEVEKFMIKQEFFSQATPNHALLLPPSFRLQQIPTSTNLQSTSKTNAAPSSGPHISTPSQVEKITRPNPRKRKNDVNDQQPGPSTSASRPTVVQQPKPKTSEPQAKQLQKTTEPPSKQVQKTAEPPSKQVQKTAEPTAKQLPKTSVPTDKQLPKEQEVARSILSSIMKKKQQGHPNRGSTSSRANNGHGRTFSDASIQTDLVTPFHHYVHELLVIMTDTDPGKIEDVETVVTNIVEEYRQSNN